MVLFFISAFWFVLLFLCAFFMVYHRVRQRSRFIFFLFLLQSSFPFFSNGKWTARNPIWSAIKQVRNEDWSVLSNHTFTRHKLINYTVQIKAVQQHSPIIAQMVLLLNDQSHNRSKSWLWFIHMGLLTCSRDWEIPSREYAGMYVGSVYVMSIMSSW